MIRAAVARALERGVLKGTVTDAASRLWERRAQVTRPVRLPPGATVIGVGGAVLGGSYKTPLALALGLALRSRGVNVCVVGHGYGTVVASARVATAVDTAASIGDDAVWLARELSPAGVPVVVGRRDEALALAAEQGAVVIVDGLLQARPQRLALSLLVVDAVRPWGSDACPPAGDRRASKSSLLAAADAVVAVHDRASQPELRDVDVNGRLPVFQVAADVSAHLHDGRPVALDALRGARVGAVLAVARPHRFLDSLAARGIRPVATRLFADHATPEDGGRREHAVDIWLTTPKCATKLGGAYSGAPLAVVRQSFVLPDALLAGWRAGPDSRVLQPAESSSSV